MSTIASDVRVDRKRRMKQHSIQELEKETLKAHLEVRKLWLFNYEGLGKGPNYTRRSTERRRIG
jgi:hypothetical protein